MNSSLYLDLVRDTCIAVLLVGLTILVTFSVLVIIVLGTRLILKSIKESKS